ncbi:MAG TPA: sporulation protein YqfC [Bacillota bacterium]|nr:sporulation protein YqfC [Bacillota bacterium]
MALKEKGKRLQNKLAYWLEIPSDIALDLPKITLIGGYQAFIENHRGILEYNTRLIRIKVSTGQLVISGRDLLVRNILQQEISVEGNITSVEISEE